MLRLVNSSFFGRAEQLMSVPAAVQHLGLDHMRTLALAAKAFVPDGAMSLAGFAVELEVFGAPHGGVGAYLLGLWGLPDAIVEAVACHDQPDAAVGNPIAAAVQAAHAVAQRARTAQRSFADEARGLARTSSASARTTSSATAV